VASNKVLSAATHGETWTRKELSTSTGSGAIDNRVFFMGYTLISYRNRQGEGTFSYPCLLNLDVVRDVLGKLMKCRLVLPG
jgi:hypothetical protein